jgi:hypothetical protein
MTLNQEQYELAIKNEEEVIKTICVIWNCDYTTTNKDTNNRFSRIDGFFTRNNEIKGVYEIRSRNQTLSWFRDYKSVLVGIDKIIEGSELSKKLNCPYFFILRTSCKKIILFQITDANGSIICDMNIRRAQTQKSSIYNENHLKKQSTIAFLQIDDNVNCFIFDEEKYEDKVLEKYGSK